QHRTWHELYRNLLRIRQRAIVPLVRCIRTGETTSKVLDGHGLLASWKVKPRGSLNLFANLGAEQLTHVERPRGELLYATSDTLMSFLAEGRMLPWSVVWFIEE